ncbi:MAG: hypothetical protein ACLS5G_09300 [Streptococcus sp.]
MLTVPDHNLPGKEVVTASVPIATERHVQMLKLQCSTVKTRTFGNDFQGSTVVPSLIEGKIPSNLWRMQISNRKLTTNGKSRNGRQVFQWKTSKVLELAMSYKITLPTNTSVKAGQTFLPKQMTEITSGFRRLEMMSNTSIGITLLKCLYSVGQPLVLLDKNGNITREQVIDGKKYFFLDNGLSYVMSRQGSDGHSIATILGVQAFNGSMTLRVLRRSLFDGNGQMYHGLHDMYGTTFYFDEKTGIQKRQVHPFCRLPTVTHPRYRKSRSQPICAKS